MKGNGHTNSQPGGGISFGGRRRRVISTQGAEGSEGSKDGEGGENREDMETLADSESQAQDTTVKVSALRTRAAAGRAKDNTARLPLEG
jgi:hypothetical protein